MMPLTLLQFHTVEWIFIKGRWLRNEWFRMTPQDDNLMLEVRFPSDFEKKTISTSWFWLGIVMKTIIAVFTLRQSALWTHWKKTIFALLTQWQNTIFALWTHWKKTIFALLTQWQKTIFALSTQWQKTISAMSWSTLGQKWSRRYFERSCKQSMFHKLYLVKTSQPLSHAN